jgi:hypothetical protein
VTDYQDPFWHVHDDMVDPLPVSWLPQPEATYTITWPGGVVVYQTGKVPNIFRRWATRFVFGWKVKKL